MLYNVIVKMIEAGMTEGLTEKIDIFYATGKLSDSEYQNLQEMLKEK